MILQSGLKTIDLTIGDNVIEIFYIILFLIPILFIVIKFEKQIKWLLTPLIWVKNILDHEWWADLIGEKSGAYERARRPNKFKTWKLKQPLWKQVFIEVLMFTLIALAFEPVLNMLGMSMLPWRWF